MKEWILIVVPIYPIIVVSIFFSIPSFLANQRQAAGQSRATRSEEWVGVENANLSFNAKKLGEQGLFRVWGLGFSVYGLRAVYSYV